MFGLGNKGTTADATVRVGFKGKEAEKGLKSLKRVVASVISIVVIKKVAEYTWELGKLGAKADSVAENFENMAKKQGRSVDDMMAKMKRATLGMVDDMQLQQKAMAGLIAGIDFDDMIVAMEYVTKYAAATGADINTKMQSTMTGLIRGSAQFLDDVGIQVMGSKNVVVDAVAQMKEKMDQFTTSEDDAAVKAAKLEATMKNLAVTASQLLQPAFNKLLDSTTELVSGWSYLFGVGSRYNAMITTQMETIQRLSLEYHSLGESIKDANKKGTENVTWIGDDLQIRTEKMAVALAELEALRSQIGIFSSPKKTEGTEGTGGLSEAEKKARAKATEELNKWYDERLKTQTEADQELIEAQIETLEKEIALIDEAESRKKEIIDIAHSDKMEVVNEANALIIKSETDLHEERLALLEYQLYLYPDLNREINLLIEEENERHNEVIVAGTRKAMEERQDAYNDALNVFSMVGNGMMRISGALTEKELNDARKSSKTQEEYQKKREKIMAEAAQRDYNFALFQQGLQLAKAIGDAAYGIIGVTSSSKSVASLVFNAVVAAAEFGIMLANVQQAPPPPAPNFATGRDPGLIGNINFTRQVDDINAMIGEGEFLSDAPTTARHLPELRAMRNGTYDREYGGGQTVNNIYGVSDEQFLQLTVVNGRMKRTGTAL